MSQVTIHVSIRDSGRALCRRFGTQLFQLGMYRAEPIRLSRYVPKSRAVPKQNLGTSRHMYVSTYKLHILRTQAPSSCLLGLGAGVPLGSCTVAVLSM